jgi:hypothetical protein
MKLLEVAPIWAVGLAVLAGLGLAHSLGLWLGRRRERKGDKPDEGKGYLVSSALALLGLLMAFTFSSAQDRFRLRQELVVSEANAIGTTYLRSQVLPAPWRDEIGRQLLHYTELRVGFGRTVTAREVTQNARDTQAAQDRIWASLSQALRSNPVEGLNVSLLATTNEMFDMASSARAARETRVPITIVRVLLISAAAVAAMVGYAEGSGRVHAGLGFGVMLLLTLAFCLILDLDRPTTGRVTISQAPLQWTLDSLRDSEARKAQQPAAGLAP